MLCRLFSVSPSLYSCPGIQACTVSSKPADLQGFYDFGLRHIGHGLGRITTGIVTKGDGSYVEYDDRTRYLDFTCGIGGT
jgi:4-aminobutyrate aminotransferase